jgi:hypothetical protein
MAVVVRRTKMTEYFVGFDSTGGLSKNMFSAAANAGAPLFWGRYFHAPGRKNYRDRFDAVFYDKAENNIFNALSCRLLPIARQTPTVGGSRDLGVAHAKRNVGAIFEAIPPTYAATACPAMMVFLDVEPDTPMSKDYYAGWSATLEEEAMRQSSGAVRFLAAVYLNTIDQVTIASLRSAVAEGSKCAGLWTAHYTGDRWVHTPAWNDRNAIPAGDSIPPVLAWQCLSEESNGCPGFDMSLLNQSFATELTSKLIVPPLVPEGVLARVRALLPW